MLNAVINKNDKKARWLIGIFSFVVFAIIVALGKIKLGIQVALIRMFLQDINAGINSLVAVLLVAGT